MSFLPGMFPGVHLGSELLFTHDFVGDANGSNSVDLGALSAGTIQAGDFALIFNVATQFTNVPATVVPSGFTSLVNTSATAGDWAGKGIVSGKILTGSEGSVSGMNPSESKRMIALVFRPNRPITGFAWNAGGAEVTGGNPSEQTIAAPGSGTIIVAGHMGAFSNSVFSTVNPRSVSPSMDEVQGGTNGHYAHYKIYNSGGVSHTYDMDDEGTINVMQSGYVTFTS